MTNLDLLFCPCQPSESVETRLVVNTMLAYWTPWLGGERARREGDKLEERADGRAERAGCRVMA